MTGWIGLYATGLMQGVPAYARVLELVIAKVSSNPDYPMILGFAVNSTLSLTYTLPISLNFIGAIYLSSKPYSYEHLKSKEIA